MMNLESEGGKDSEVGEDKPRNRGAKTGAEHVLVRGLLLKAGLSLAAVLLISWQLAVFIVSRYYDHQAATTRAAEAEGPLEESLSTWGDQRLVAETMLDCITIAATIEEHAACIEQEEARQREAVETKVELDACLAREAAAEEREPETMTAEEAELEETRMAIETAMRVTAEVMEEYIPHLRQEAARRNTAQLNACLAREAARSAPPAPPQPPDGTVGSTSTP